jgi:hypothetical protein
MDERMDGRKKKREKVRAKKREKVRAKKEGKNSRAPRTADRSAGG